MMCACRAGRKRAGADTKIIRPCSCPRDGPDRQCWLCFWGTVGKCLPVLAVLSPTPKDKSRTHAARHSITSATPRSCRPNCEQHDAGREIRWLVKQGRRWAGGGRRYTGKHRTQARCSAPQLQQERDGHQPQTTEETATGGGNGQACRHAGACTGGGSAARAGWWPDSQTPGTQGPARGGAARRHSTT